MPGDSKTFAGNFFEDFEVGRRFRHATPRTITSGDASLYIALTGARQPLFCSAPLAMLAGYRTSPVDDLLVFNIAFGKTVRDISFNAIANLGYADVRFLAPVYIGDTISVESEITGVKPASSGDRGVAFLHSAATNQDGAPILSWNRWVLIHARGPLAGGRTFAPELPTFVEPSRLIAPPLELRSAALAQASGSERLWGDYAAGERIDHPAGMTLDESDHVFATRLYQNSARVHFDALMMQATPHGRRLVYGGHVISVCRALSYDGLENALTILAINGGTHAAPTFAGDTLYAFSRVLELFRLPERCDVGALRLQLVGLRNRPPADLADEDLRTPDGRLHPDVVLELDYTVLMPIAENPQAS